MKKFLLSLFTLISFSIVASAQIKAVETATISTPTVQCGMCKTKIESYLKKYPGGGIASVDVNYKKKETKVKYLTDRVNIEEIITAIANAGYDAEYKDSKELANPDSYKRLPKCCKKPEDGGGMK